MTTVDRASATLEAMGLAIRSLLALHVVITGCGRLGYAVEPVADSGLDVGPPATGTIDPCDPPGPPPAPTELTILSHSLHATTTDAPWAYTMRSAGGTGVHRWALLSGPPGFTLDPSGDATYSPSGAGRQDVQVSLTDDAGGRVDATLELRVLTTRVCVWQGATSDAFGDASNWDFCAGGVPAASEWVVVDRLALREPLVSTSTSVLGFGPSSGAEGTLRVASGQTLTLLDTTRTIQSSVRLAGATPSCTDCIVSVPGEAYVVGEAMLVLDNGIEFRVPDHTSLFIGTARPVEVGHLVACGERGPLGEWPTFSSPPAADPGHYGIRIAGGPGTPSTVSIDGLRFTNIHHIDGADAYMLDFVDHYRIDKLDHVRFETYYDGQDIAIRIDGCAGSNIADAVWEDIQLEIGTEAGAINVEVACDPGAPICLPDASGVGAGETFEVDPFDVLGWDGRCP